MAVIKKLVKAEGVMDTSRTDKRFSVGQDTVIGASGEAVPGQWLRLTFNGIGNLESLSASDGDFVNTGQELVIPYSHLLINPLPLDNGMFTDCF